MAEHEASRGFAGAVLKLFRAGDYRLTVTGRREISPHYLRLSFDAGGMLGDNPVHPTMWIRMWFADGDKLHQRGFTLVNPDPAAGTTDIEFALHDGIASHWARTAQPGDTVEATVLGSKFAIPEPPPAGYVIVGDTASLPAINSLLGAIGDAPARRVSGGRPRRRQGSSGGAATPESPGWTARTPAKPCSRRCSRRRSTPTTTSAGWPATSRTTRSVVKVLREDFGIPPKST